MTNYRNMTITAGRFGFNVEIINCFGCDSVKFAQAAIDRYLDGDNNPQCRLQTVATAQVAVECFNDA